MKTRCWAKPKHRCLQTRGSYLVFALGRTQENMSEPNSKETRKDFKLEITNEKKKFKFSH